MKNVSIVFRLAMLLLVVTLMARQWQMQSEINRMQESELQFKRDMLEFMKMTNGSIDSHSAAIESQTRIMKIIIERR